MKPASPILVAFPLDQRALFLSEMLGRPVRVLCGRCGYVVKCCKIDMKVAATDNHYLYVDHVVIDDESMEQFYLHRDDLKLYAKCVLILVAQENN